MSSFFSFFYSKPKAEEVMATTSLANEEPTTPPIKPTTEDSQSEPQSPVNLLSPPRQTQPQTSPSQSPSSQLSSQPQTPSEQEISKNSTALEESSNSYSDDEILSYIAENNELNASWLKVMRIIKERLEKTCQDSEISITINGEDSDKTETCAVVENHKRTINQLLDNFERPPFTIQRLSELMLKPFQHHKTLVKWLRAVEKVLTVQSSLDAFPSISNTITPTDKLELMEVTTSPKLVPISFAYNAEEIEKENANSPKLVPIKFTYNAELEVADNEEEADDMNEDYYYDKQEILNEMDEEGMQGTDEEEKDDMFAEKSEDNTGNIFKKKRDYNVEDNMIEENEGSVKKMVKKKREYNAEDGIIEEDSFEDAEKDDDVDSLFEEKNKTVEDREKKEKNGESIKDNVIEENEKNKKNARLAEEKREVIDSKERSKVNVGKNSKGEENIKIEKISEENIENNKKEKNKLDQEKELFRGRSENKVFATNEEKTEEEKLREIKEKIKKRIK